MTIHRNRELLSHVLRANPAYELVLYDRLEPGVREALADLRKDPDFYGVLRPREAAGLGVKSVDRETALLFLTLREPGPLPAYFERVAGVEAGRVMARLVADSVLEVERAGAFVSGPAAFDLLQGEEGSGERGRLASLSIEALRYGQALDVSDPLRLSMRLYGYNRRPLTPAWKRLLPSAEAVERYLGCASGGTNKKLLDRGWSRFGASNEWISWRSRAADAVREAGGPGVTWKLYVSPAPEALADGFGRVLEALALARAPQFKIGADAVGLLRPDKIVAYFPTFERLALAADAIAKPLSGTPAQGVPFTSEIGGDGLLSWGVDPPGKERESWRFWLTHRLARALLAGKAAGEGVEPWRFALERLRLEGVNTDSWTPGALLWRES